MIDEKHLAQCPQGSTLNGKDGKQYNHICVFSEINGQWMGNGGKGRKRKVGWERERPVVGLCPREQ